jgi:peptide deformylase
MKVEDISVQLGEKHDEALKMVGGPVNIRLFKENKAYKRMILHIVDYMCDCMDASYENYTDLCGISGANIGIPLNIIVVNLGEEETVMLNPEIIDASEETRIAKSNCGSLNLPEPIEVERHKSVIVKYYDEDGVKKVKDIKEGAGTTQHEIDHNKGIMILDRETKESRSKRKEEEDRKRLKEIYGEEMPNLGQGA